MIIVTDEFDKLLAYAKSLRTVNNYFRFANNGTDMYRKANNKLVRSKRYNINVKLIDDKKGWHKQQSIIFLKDMTFLEKPEVKE